MKNKCCLIAKLLTILALGICMMPEANDSIKKTKMKDLELHPDFPVVQGTYQMTKEWSVTLPGRFSRRIEEGSLVLWRPGFTIWTSVWRNNKKESAEKRLKETIGMTSKDKYAEKRADDNVLRYAYRLDEDGADDRVPAFYCFAFGESGHVQMAIYFDDEKDVKWAEMIWRSLKEEKKKYVPKQPVRLKNKPHS